VDGAPTVVFVPGFMQRDSAWAPVAERLGERYRSVCLDHAEHTLEGRLREIESAAPPGAALAGYSMGGRLGLHASLRDPRRYGALVLVGATAGIEDPAERGARRASDEELARWIERQPIEAIVSRWEATPALAGQSAELVARQRPGRLSHEPRDLASLLRSAGQGAMEPVWDRLRELPMPVLALAGERDRGYVRAAVRIASLVPRGAAHAIPRAGHAAHLEQPHLVADLIRSALPDQPRP
jgi:2-succinyl-6-hydroxy-2,4-cyclohexadiene-1-carboxylate synthase